MHCSGWESFVQGDRRFTCSMWNKAILSLECDTIRANSASCCHCNTVVRCKDEHRERNVAAHNIIVSAPSTYTKLTVYTILVI